ncbi:hypothetical protein MSG28_004086, partial [Choristoneura fumiferana]
GASTRKTTLPVNASAPPAEPRARKWRQTDSECGAGATSAAGAAVAAALQFFAASQCLVREDWPINAAVDTLAARLARLPGSVLLLEAGSDPPVESIIPGFRYSLKGSQYDWNFTSVDDSWSSQALRGGQRQPRGHMLGGSGSLNDMVYARGYPADYDEWATIVGDIWNWTTVLEYFKKTEYLTDERIIDDPELMKYHGRSGDIEVTGLRESTNVTDRFLEAFKELGFAMVKDMTYPKLIGAGRFSHTIRDGRRDSTLTAMLNKVENDRNNLKVVKQAFVTKILIQNNTAYGVEVLLNGDQFTFFANKEVVVTAGTFNTPKLLMLSGLGPKDQLENLDIAVIKDLPVGENLHDHIMVLTFLAADNGTCYSPKSESHMDVIRYLYDRTGSLSMTNSMGAYIKDPSVDGPLFAIYPSCMPVNTQFYQQCVELLGFKEKICAKLQSELENYEVLPLAVVLLKPKSRGRLRLQSKDPSAAPLIYSGTFNDTSDLTAFPDALNVAWSVANTSYFRMKNARVVELEVDVCADSSELEKVKCDARAMATSAWHATGTAALGAVLDARLRVRGVAHLRVADASVMPKIIRGNTNAPVVMIAERAADFIKEEHYGTNYT